MPLPLIILAAVLLFCVLLALLRVRVLITYKEEVRLSVRVLFLRIPLYPKKPPHPRRFSRRALAKKAKKERLRAAKKAKKRTEAATGATDKRRAQHRGALSMPEKLELVKALLAALVRATDKHLYLKAARLHLRVATGDAASTAIAYGAVSGTLAGILALIDRVTVLRAEPPDVAVYADYLSESHSADVRLVFSMRVGGALLSLVSLALAYLRARRAQTRARREAADTPTL